MTIDAEMLDLFVEEMKLCKVTRDELVIVLTNGTGRVEMAQAFMIAARSLGATSLQINVPDSSLKVAGVQGRHALAGNRSGVEMLKQADLVIDMLGLLFSKEQLEIQSAGTRILRVMEPLHVLKQMFPTADLARRVELSRSMLMDASRLHITSPAGTDITYKLGQYPVLSEYGYTDEPGRWDHWPSGFAFTQGNDGEVDGTVVLQPGDILCAFKRYVTAPVRLTIEKGYVTSIDGDGFEAALIRSYIESFNDPRGYAVSHIGWGSNENAKWHHIAATPVLSDEHVMNALAFYGNVLFSTGPNTELGGDNDTPCHLDIPLRDCSLWLDETQVLDQGQFVIDALKAE